MRTPLWACLALVVSAGDDFDTHAAGDHFDTHAHFFSARDGQTLESLPVRARTVRAGGSRLGEDGWAFVPFDPAVAEAVGALAAACYPHDNASALACVTEHFARRPDAVDALSARVRAAVAAALPPSAAARLACAADPSRWAVFERQGLRPQNMHYDAVEADAAPCDAVSALSVRAWLPLRTVGRAPMLVANTTGLHADQCARRAAPAGAAAVSPTAAIVSRARFEAECARAPAACGWFHTLGVRAGEALLLRNDVALHGTAEHGGDGLRVSLAVDCRWSPTAAADSDTETTPWARGWPP